MESRWLEGLEKMSAAGGGKEREVSLRPSVRGLIEGRSETSRSGGEAGLPERGILILAGTCQIPHPAGLIPAVRIIFLRFRPGYFHYPPPAHPIFFLPMKRRALPFTLLLTPLAGFTVLLTSLPAHAQLTLNALGGTVGAGNYATLPGTAAFGLNEIGGGTLPQHKIPNVRDGIFGNNNSWIGDTNNSFIGLNFGATAMPVGRIAWGRDNTNTGFADRTIGLFTVEYTQVPNPGAGTAVTGNPLTGWASVGTMNYLTQGVLGSPLSMSLRHEWSFPSVNATGLRLTAPGSSFANGSCIDELEAYTASAPKFGLVTTGGTMDVATNIGLTSTAFAKDLINNGGFPAHTIPNINDGLYGNGESWIGNSEASFAGLDFNGSFTVNRFAFGRDNLDAGGLTDRSGGTYRLQYTTVSHPDATTPDANWITVGELYYDHNGADTADRHEYSFAPVTATGMRLFVSGNGVGSGNAIDEFEVYGIPEPAGTVLLLSAGTLLLRRRRRA